jgi:hypothetical protein
MTSTDPEDTSSTSPDPPLSQLHQLSCFGCCRWKNDDRNDFDFRDYDGWLIIGSKDAIKRRCKACQAVGGGPYERY